MRLFVLILFLIMFAVTPVSAHRDGCHAAHSCPSDTGSYVCGDTGNYSECGGAQPDTAKTAPVEASTAPVKQFVNIPTKVPTRIPTSLPTNTPTVEPTKAPTNTPEPTETVAVAGESEDKSSGGGSVLSLAILGGLGYLGYRKFKKKKVTV